MIKATPTTLIWLILACCPLMAQNGEGAPSEEKPPPAETEEQATVRAVSLAEIKEADQRLLDEREALTKSERRIEMLIEELNNRSRDIESREQKLKDMVAEQQALQQEDESPVPQVQIDHWNSRDPVVAAHDFILLYRKKPDVAVNLVKGMKKKKSAALIDEVSKIGGDGIEVAATLHKAIGTGRVNSQD